MPWQVVLEPDESIGGEWEELRDLAQTMFEQPNQSAKELAATYCAPLCQETDAMSQSRNKEEL
jgi:hypothetical protein